MEKRTQKKFLSSGWELDPWPYRHYNQMLY